MSVKKKLHSWSFLFYLTHNDAWLFKHCADFLFAFKVAGSTGAMKSVDEERIVDVSGNLTSLDKKLVC